MKLAIENFSKTPADNKILVLGAMAELGQNSLKEHKEIIDLIKRSSWKNVLLVGGDFTKQPHSFLQFDNAEEAGHWLKQNKIEESYLLIKGSRSGKMEKVLDYLEP